MQLKRQYKVLFTAAAAAAIILAAGFHFPVALSSSFSTDLSGAQTGEQNNIDITEGKEDKQPSSQNADNNKPEEPIRIVIDKSDHTLSLFAGNKYLKSYHVEFGDGGPDAKEIMGDHKTPEGNFYISQKSILRPADEYLGSRWLRISYPNIADADRGIEKGLISAEVYNQIAEAIHAGAIPPQTTPLGGGVGIHGGGVPEFGKNWTWGCIGLSNADIEDFYDNVGVGTEVIIQK